jgi:hypothetical protein
VTERLSVSLCVFVRHFGDKYSLRTERLILADIHGKHKALVNHGRAVCPWLLQPGGGSGFRTRKLIVAALHGGAYLQEPSLFY